MGLDVSHGCWSGAYSAFNRWRNELAKQAGIPLELMEGFWGHTPASRLLMHSAYDALRPDDGPNYSKDVAKWLPIKWEVLKPDPLLVLLDHSDCDGDIKVKDCGPLADRLEELLPKLPEGSGGGHIGDWREKTQKFIDGLRLAVSLDEDVQFY